MYSNAIASPTVTVRCAAAVRVSDAFSVFPVGIAFTPQNLEPEGIGHAADSPDARERRHTGGIDRL